MWLILLDTNVWVIVGWNKVIKFDIKIELTVCLVTREIESC